MIGRHREDLAQALVCYLQKIWYSSLESVMSTQRFPLIEYARSKILVSVVFEENARAVAD